MLVRGNLFSFTQVDYQLDSDNIHINFNGVHLILKLVDFMKYFGKFIEKFLNWKHHITNLSKQLSHAMGFFINIGIMPSLNFFYEFFIQFAIFI